MIELSRHPIPELDLLRRLELTLQADWMAIELAIQVIQIRRFKDSPLRPWRQSCESAANSLHKFFPEATVATRSHARALLREAASLRPTTDDARLLCDAMNLADFGVHGLFSQALRHGAADSDLPQFLEAFQRQQDYGYWEARLKDDFHFEPVRRLAAERLEHVRQLAAMLKKEQDGIR
jgi:hypothetical protein